MVVIEEGVSVAELDEALANISASLKVDKYGDRMDWRKKALYLQSIDDLLDERLELSRRVQGGTE
jgi:hypothetical protein